eukprot:18898_1
MKEILGEMILATKTQINMQDDEKNTQYQSQQEYKHKLSLDSGILQLINSSLIFNHETIKWKKFKTSHGYTYCPVFVVQDLIEKPLIVLDIWGKYWRIKNRTELVEFPLTTEPKYISSHIELLKRICEIYA